VSKKKFDSKAFSQLKRRRRRVLTFVRMIRYGVNNFSRNAWLTVAATAVMTITLLIVFTAVTARQVLISTVSDFQDKVEMTIYLKHDSTQGDIDKVSASLRKLSSVKSVSTTTPDQYRQEYIDQNKSSASSLNSLNNADPEFPWKVRIKVFDINNTSQLQQYVDSDQTVKDLIDSQNPPSFAGPYKTAIEKIGGWVSFADRVGLIAGIIFVAISSLIIFNTIRMAIFNRREEIQMMKLIGADRSFIRGPFIVEAIMYGFIAAIIATGIGILGLYGARNTLVSQGIAIDPTIEFVTVFAPFVLLAMILVGGIIGIISSLFATRRYLKI
jgi:cell division transport system permease protein